MTDVRPPQRAGSRLIALNKPYGVLSQFTDANGRPTLADVVRVAGVYPAGRLDRDSEGLLLLTDDGRLQARIAHPRHKLAKTYLLQVEREVDEHSLELLRAGVVIEQRRTLPAQVGRIEEPAWLWPRLPPVRFRKSVPTSWLEVTICEGRNRQLRRMLAAVGHPVLRLVRSCIGPWTLGDLPNGQWHELDVSLLK
ncbi:MAG: 23S rRNA pseudouridine2457 synthase [Gammaproteobacteria bacterium]|jgi:23S rRNA pseudouridine2457 synthase